MVVFFPPKREAPSMLFKKQTKITQYEKKKEGKEGKGNLTRNIYKKIKKRLKKIDKNFRNFLAWGTSWAPIYSPSMQCFHDFFCCQFRHTHRFLCLYSHNGWQHSNEMIKCCKWRGILRVLWFAERKEQSTMCQTPLPLYRHSDYRSRWRFAFRAFRAFRQAVWNLRECLGVIAF